MSDEIDVAQEQEMHAREMYLREARRRVTDIPTGEAGECDYCGEWNGRIINGACSPCRDKRKLK